MSSLPLAAGAWCWHDDYYAGRWSLLDQPAGAAAAGLAAIECNDFMLPPPRLSRVRQRLLDLLPGAPPELWRYSRATLHRLQNNAQANGVHILAWAINSDFTVAGHHWPAQRLYLRRGIAAARLLAAPLLRVTLGGCAETPRSRDALIVRRLAALVQASPTPVTLENHWGVSADIERHVQIFDAVAATLPSGLRARFGCCFDPGNLPEGPQRPHWWRMLAHRANHFHLKTTAFDATGDEVHLSYATIFDLLAEVGYGGPVTVEYGGQAPPLAGIQQSVHLYRRLVNTQHG
jgi:sugar phosphate isomerase/epimerase